MRSLQDDAPSVPCIPRVPRSRTRHTRENDRNANLSGGSENDKGVNLSGGSEETRDRGPPAGSLAGLADDDDSAPVSQRHISSAVHRVKNMHVVYGPWALVARPVNMADVSRTPAAEAVVAKVAAPPVRRRLGRKRCC